MNAFDREGAIVICSYHVAAAKAFEMQQVAWDLVVIDEAHRLRNVFKKSSRIAASIRDATQNRQKLLLTATPLQNSLMELYGLASVADPHIFGDERSFREQFAEAGYRQDGAERLKQHIAPLCKRTLRKQVDTLASQTAFSISDGNLIICLECPIRIETLARR